MKLVRTEFNHIHLPMMEDDDSMLYATTKVSALALATSERELIEVVRFNKGRLQCLNTGSLRAKEFLKQNRVEFGIKRVRADMLLWSIPDLMLATVCIKTPEADQFRIEFARIVIENVKRSLVTTEQYNKLQAELEEQRANHNALLAQVTAMQDLVLQTQPALAQAAAAAGSALNAQKKVRLLRVVK